MTGSVWYQQWVAAGRPDSGLALPLAQLRDTLRAAGWLVYDWPDDSHLLASRPEDHTQFSQTGWPGTSPHWWRHAIDVMPDGKGAGALYDLGARIASDRNAGVPGARWLKYINRPDVRGSLSTAIQDSWQPSHATRGSSDVGHLHLSSITGVETVSIPYNPLIGIGVDAMAIEITDVYNTMVNIANGGQPTKGGSVAVPDWVKTMQSYGPKLDAIAAELDALKAAVAAQNAGGIDQDALNAAVQKAVNAAMAGAAFSGTVSGSISASRPMP